MARFNEDMCSCYLLKEGELNDVTYAYQKHFHGKLKDFENDFMRGKLTKQNIEGRVDDIDFMAYTLEKLNVCTIDCDERTCPREQEKYVRKPESFYEVVESEEYDHYVDVLNEARKSLK